MHLSIYCQNGVSNNQEDPKHSIWSQTYSSLAPLYDHSLTSINYPRQNGKFLLPAGPAHQSNLARVT